MPKLYLIDGHAYLHRAFHALPPLNTSHGIPVNAVYGFLRMILKIQKQEKPDFLAVCFDTPVPTFRHAQFADYKATRKEMDEALKVQVPLAHELVQALNIPIFERDGFEADDVMAYLTRLARQRACDVVIVSGDKDTLQLVGDGVCVLNESKNILYDPEKVRERYGVSPEQIPDVFALMGDASDNVPGVKGIGEKTAIKLIQEYGTLEDLLKAAPQLKGKVAELLQAQAESARKSWSLVALHHDVPLTVDWESLRSQTPDTATLVPLLQRLEFYALLKDYAPAAGSGPSGALIGRDYALLQTDAALKAWCEKAKASSRLAVDVETTGLDPLHAELVGISLSFQSGTGVYLPIGHRLLGVSPQLPLDLVQRSLQPLLSDPQKRIYGHNLKFDLLVLKRHGFLVVNVAFDSMVASYVLNPSRSSHGLKDLSLELLHEPMIRIEGLIGKGAKQITMDLVEPEKAMPYACADVDMTLRLSDLLETQIREKGLEKLFIEMEMPLVQVLADMEESGIRIDRSYLSQFGVQLAQQMLEIEAEIYTQAGERFNINSPKQLAVILFEKLKLPIIRKTKTGFSTDEEVLRTLSPQHALPAKLMEFREIQKLHSTYVEGLQQELPAGEDRVHTSFNQTVTATGRLSSSNPNLQNIPIRTELGRKIRKAFIPADGHVFLSADYSQIDLRVLAHVSQDKILCEAFLNGQDIHAITAAEVFSKSLREVTPDLRRMAKSINFGIVYGISAYGLSQQLGITPGDAQTYIDQYFLKYAGVKAWIDSILVEAREKGCVRTLAGRVRYLPEINSKNSAVRGFAERTAMNTPIQGTSADIIKLAMIHLQQVQTRCLWAGRMLVQVHDELLFEIPEKELLSSAPVIKNAMEQAMSLCIPLIVDLKTGHDWAEMTPLKVSHGV